MKKTIIVLSLVIFVIAGLSFNAQAAENSPLPSDQASAGQVAFPVLSVSIGDWQLPKASYEAGEKIEGKFKLKNATNYYVSGIFYEIGIHQQSLDPKNDPIFFLNDATLYDRLRVMDSISFSPQEEKEISFSYQIPKYFPAGEKYYFQIAIFTPREQLLAQDYRKISIGNPEKNEKFIFLNSRQSNVFGEDRLYGYQGGPVFDFDVEYNPTKDESEGQFLSAPPLPQVPEGQQQPTYQTQLPTTLKNQVKVKLSFLTKNGEVKKPNIKLTSYRYGAPLKEISSRLIKSAVDLAKNSSGLLYFQLPLFEDPGAYETFIQFFDGDERISNPLGFRYITSGDSSMVSQFLVEKKDENNFVLNVLFAGPADVSQRDTSQDFVTQLAFTVREEKTNKTCLSKMSDINLKETAFLSEPFTLENCSAPYVFEAQLKKDGKILDEQKTKIESLAGEPSKITNMWFIVMIIILFLIGVFVFFYLRFKKQKMPPAVTGLFILLLLIGSFALVGSAKAFSAPSLLSPDNNAEVTSDPLRFDWTRPSGFTPGFNGQATRQVWVPSEWGGGWVDVIVDIYGWYKLDFDSGGYVIDAIETGESASVPSASLPAPNHTWQVTANKGTKIWGCLAWVVSEWGSACLGYGWIYTPEESAVSVVNNFSKPAAYDGFRGYAAHVGYYGNYQSGIGQTVPIPAGWPWLTWQNVRFNDATDQDARLDVYAHGGAQGLGWWVDQFQYFPYSYDAANNYFNVDASVTSLRLDNYMNPSPNCGNWEGIGGGSFAFFIVDENNNLVKQFQAPGKWYFSYPEYSFNSLTANLAIGNLQRDKKYTLILQDYKIFHGGWGDPGYLSAYYVGAPFCYGNCAPPSPTLTVTKAGTGFGTVTSAPAGINCGATCSASYPSGTSVTLTASSSGGSTFAGWSGDADCSDGSVTMSATRSCTATFNVANQAPVAVATISKDGLPCQETITVTQGISASIFLCADGSSDPNGWTNATNGVSSGGKCEWNSNLNQGAPVFEGPPEVPALPINNPGSAAACNIGPLRPDGTWGAGATLTFNDSPGTYTYQVLRITDRPGAVSNIDTVSVTVLAPPNQAPSASNLSVTQPYYCIITWPTAIFSWQFIDPDNDTQSAYQIQADNNSNFSSPEVDSGKVLSSSNSYATLPGALSWNTSYYWRLRVWDSEDTPSADWIVYQNNIPPPESFNTPRHAYPSPNFTPFPQNPAIAQIVTFFDDSKCYSSPGNNEYNCSAGGSISYLWDFGNGQTSTIKGNATTTYATTGPRTVSLTITDNSLAPSGICETTRQINTSLPPPEWTEIPPF